MTFRTSKKWKSLSLSLNQSITVANQLTARLTDKAQDHGNQSTKLYPGTKALRNSMQEVPQLLRKPQQDPLISSSSSENSGSDAIFTGAFKDSISTTMPFLCANSATITDISSLLTDTKALLRSRAKASSDFTSLRNAAKERVDILEPPKKWQ
ncbi:MAG: hypothetical protein DWQ54_10425 [Microcystis flos-aquae TF09]|uniref:Uncharacterized protein n=1 Tax=Microcystis flos-aquae TF09 TaxID=2060473 RepID=A0A3E0L803_9CHRO|nr:MAG: hypothetical protein DWQ54_10425 [Microcystis flos-aquae TF09]